MRDTKLQATEFFDVNDTIVRVDSDGKLSKGLVVATGASFPPAKAVVDGLRITPDEAKRRLAEQSATS